MSEGATPKDNNQSSDAGAQLTYVWNWFQYHAGQRLTAFNFFLIVVGVVAVAFSQAIERDSEIFGVVVAALGAVLAVGFFGIDVRNEELVNSGLAALKELERELNVKPASRGADRDHLQEALNGPPLGLLLLAWIRRSRSVETRHRRERWFTHRLWLRSIELLVAVVFLLGAAWAAAGFPGS